MAESRGGGSALGPLEAEAMAVLWQAGGPVLVRGVVGRLNTRHSAPLAYTTVMTVLSRPAGKGILIREQQGRGFLYTPAVADTAEIAVRGVLAEFGDAALVRFVERVELDPRLRARLRKLIGEPRHDGATAAGRVAGLAAGRARGARAGRRLGPVQGTP